MRERSKATAGDAAPDPGCCSPRKKPRPRLLGPYAKLFRALSDETRLETIGLLAGADGELCVCDIESHFKLSQPTISHHLRVLREAELVKSERRGTWVYYTLDRKTLELLGEFVGVVTR